jgi:cytochrome c oxidase subunit 4
MAHEEHSASGEHIVSPKLYVGIFAFLMVMTALTVFAASVEMHDWNPVVALVIATMKATTVILFFMHVKYSPRLTQIVILAALFFLLLLLGLTLTDYLSRAWMTYPSH